MDCVLVLQRNARTYSYHVQTNAGLFACCLARNSRCDIPAHYTVCPPTREQRRTATWPVKPTKTPRQPSFVSHLTSWPDLAFHRIITNSAPAALRVRKSNKLPPLKPDGSSPGKHIKEAGEPGCCTIFFVACRLSFSCHVRSRFFVKNKSRLSITYAALWTRWPPCFIRRFVRRTGSSPKQKRGPSPPFFPGLPRAARGRRDETPTPIPIGFGKVVTLKQPTAEWVNDLTIVDGIRQPPPNQWCRYGWSRDSYCGLLEAFAVRRRGIGEQVKFVTDQDTQSHQTAGHRPKEAQFAKFGLVVFVLSSRTSFLLDYLASGVLVPSLLLYTQRKSSIRPSRTIGAKHSRNQQPASSNGLILPSVGPRRAKLRAEAPQRPSSLGKVERFNLPAAFSLRGPRHTSPYRVTSCCRKEVKHDCWCNFGTTRPS